MLIGASLAGTISRDAVNNVARSLLRNIDATQDTQALQLQATKRSLLWLISGGGDVVSLCYDVCDELYPQCFRSTASNIGIFFNFYSDCFVFFKKKIFLFNKASLFARLLRDCAPALADTILLCLSAFMQRNDFWLYAAPFAAAPLPFVLPADKSELHGKTTSTSSVSVIDPSSVFAQATVRLHEATALGLPSLGKL